MKGVNRMKYLKIENNKGLFRKKSNQWVELDQICKEDILSLLDKAIEDEFEMDEFDADLLQNKAHQIIYTHLYQKFNELITSRSRFKDESEQLYKNAIEKYTEIIKNGGNKKKNGTQKRSKNKSGTYKPQAKKPTIKISK